MEMTLTDEEIETWRLGKRTANVIQQLNTGDDDPALNTTPLRGFTPQSEIAIVSNQGGPGSVADVVK